MRSYFILFVFIFLFVGCSQKNIHKKKILHYKSIYSESNEKFYLPIYFFGLKMMISIDKEFRDKIISKNVRYSRRAFRQSGNNKIGNIGVASLSDKSTSIKKELIKVMYHSYKTISKLDDLKSLENTSTYIIFPRNISKKNERHELYERYTKVLNLVQELKVVRKDLLNTDVSKDENKFIILKKLKNKEMLTVEDYNYELSNKILDFFKEMTPVGFFDQDGPFFITTTENVFEKKEKFSFIYLNLSNFNNSAINQAINSYKNRLVEKGNEKIDIAEEWYYEILSAITNFNDNLHLFQVAVAGGE